jgi:23S rRNA (cytidine1920-2'-O)/16S rRNA (cytidine1409-2'-O)-methyltransferase
VKKQRIDILLVERGLAESRAQAQRLIMAGRVRVEGQVALKPSSQYRPGAAIELLEEPRFVSRGGEKLQAALEAFQFRVAGMICADLGASTGGFTDCLLQNGARKVIAIDVGKGILHWKLRQDPRVIVMEGVNARHLDRLPEEPDLITVDASFISVKILLTVIKRWYGRRGGAAILLVKPQFEAGKNEVDRGEGVIRDAEVHRRVLSEVLDHSQAEGFGVRGMIRSPLLGPKGNVEFLVNLVYPGQERDDLPDLIEMVISPDTSGQFAPAS